MVDFTDILTDFHVDQHLIFYESKIPNGILEIKAIDKTH